MLLILLFLAYVDNYRLGLFCLNRIDRRFLLDNIIVKFEEVREIYTLTPPCALTVFYLRLLFTHRFHPIAKSLPHWLLLTLQLIFLLFYFKSLDRVRRLRDKPKLALFIAFAQN